MPPLIFQIDELLRSVVDELVATDRGAAVAFALTCRMVEEPTLSLLWRRQHRLGTLSEVFSSPTCPADLDYHSHVVSSSRSGSCSTTNLFRITQLTGHCPLVGNRAKLKRYASWMRGLDLPSNLASTNATLSLLLRNFPGDALFPNLERLDCIILPSKYCDQREPEELQNALSTLVCQCGPSLRRLKTLVPLSEEAILHLAKLPNVSYWGTPHGPPQSLPKLAFPSLEWLRLDELEALPWLNLLASHEYGMPQDRLATPPRSARDRLKTLEYFGDTINIDRSQFLSPVAKFRNLVTLRVKSKCSSSCSFRLTDDDVRSLATELSRLELLHLGAPCSSGTCYNTAASLMSISLRCVDLEDLEIHFNTQSITRDMQHLLDRGAMYGGVRSKVRCLSVGNLPLGPEDSEDYKTVAKGLKCIFPELSHLLTDTALTAWSCVMVELYGECWNTDDESVEL